MRSRVMSGGAFYPLSDTDGGRAMSTRTKRVPYFSQWESREITSDVLARGSAVAHAEDPKWASSGASKIEEYIQWASNLSGMACLKMILAARTGRAVPM